MRQNEIYIPSGGPGDRTHLSPEIYYAMGEKSILKMLSEFYKELGRSPIRNMFADDMESASQRSTSFYVQILGGPSLYNEQ